MDIETTTNIAKTSLDFISSVLKTENNFLPVSSLPYSKKIIRDAIKRYVMDCDLSDEERQEIKMKYTLLANFLDDDKTRFMTTVDNSLKQADMKDKNACKVWVQDPKNDADYKKYLNILSEIEIEQEKLKNELAFVYAECADNSKKNVDPLPAPSDSAQILP